MADASDLLKTILVVNNCAAHCPVGLDCLRGFYSELKQCDEEAVSVVGEVQKLEGVELKLKSAGMRGHTIWVQENEKEEMTQIIFRNGERVRG